LVVNQSYELCPFADAVYACDKSWWDYRRGLPEYRGLKITYSARVGYSDVRCIRIAEGKHEILTATPGVVGDGQNSGFQALNIAIQFGAKLVILVGFDMGKEKSSVHWYGLNTWKGARNPDAQDLARWAGHFDTAAPQLIKLGVTVLNLSPRSQIQAFKKCTAQEALDLVRTL